MSNWPRVDFTQLVDKVAQSQRGWADLTILGGRCAEGDLLEFFRQWGLAEMPFRVWEYASDITFEKDTLPQNVVLLERARLFGTGGDLMLRRGGAAFDWRFIGPAGIQPPAGDYGAQDYWAGCQEMTFHQHDETALLWGKWENDHWTDDRVGAARLNYPAPAGWQRVQICYKTFSRAGQVEFVWYTGLGEWKEANNG